jgi:hypothetical protein
MAAPATQRPPPTPAPKASRLALAKRGKLARPIRALFYGPEGVGKSTLAADAPGVIFADIENSADELDVVRYPFRDGDDGTICRTLGEFYAMCDDLESTPDLAYQSLAIDTADELESRIHRFLCEREGKESIVDFGYGKGFEIALDTWRTVLSRLDRLRARGMNIILTAHCVVRTYKNPTGDDYDRYQPKLHDKAAGLIKGWCDVVGFVAWDDVAAVRKTESGRTGARSKGFGGERMVCFERTAAWDAKARIPLPERVALGVNGWAPIAEAVEASRSLTPTEVRRRIQMELDRIGDAELVEKAIEYIAGAGDDTGKLTEVLNRLKAREAVKQEA